MRLPGGSWLLPGRLQEIRAGLTSEQLDAMKGSAPGQYLRRPPITSNIFSGSTNLRQLENVEIAWFVQARIHESSVQPWTRLKSTYHVASAYLQSFLSFRVGIIAIQHFLVSNLQKWKNSGLPWNRTPPDERHLLDLWNIIIASGKAARSEHLT